MGPREDAQLYLFSERMGSAQVPRASDALGFRVWGLGGSDALLRVLSLDSEALQYKKMRYLDQATPSTQTPKPVDLHCEIPPSLSPGNPGNLPLGPHVGPQTCFYDPLHNPKP